MRIILPIVALAIVTLFAGCFLAACSVLDTTVEAIPAKPHHTIKHAPSKAVPYRWSEERLIQNNEHDDLITADGRRIAGAP